MDSVISQPFRLSPGAYFRIAVHRVIPHVALLLAIPFIGMVAVGVLLDIRFLFIAMMIPFIITPALVFNIYYFTLLHSEAKESLQTRNLEIVPHDHIVVRTLIPDTDASSDDAAGKWTVAGTDVIEWSDIESVSIVSRCIVFRMRGKRIPLAVPIDCLPSGFDYYSMIYG